MKKIILVLIIGLFISGCTGIKTMSRGLENNSYLEFIGDPDKYGNGVTVVVDDNTQFTAFVNKPNAKKPKGSVYAIEDGQHTISVSYNSTLLYLKQVFISSQETKQITLP